LTGDNDRQGARAYDEAPVAMVTVTGSSHRLTSCNAAYRALVGQQAGLAGTALVDRWPGPEAQELIDLLDHVSRTAEPEQVAEWCAWLDLDGPTEVYLDLTAMPYLAPDGAVGGVHLVLVDATDRVATRQRVAARQRRDNASPASVLDVVATLQSELLPVALPVLPGTDLAATYLLSPDSTRVGGDWFDCVVRPDGTVALVVGDVVGRGVAAVAAMSQLRAVLSDHLSAGASLHEALTRLDVGAASRPESRATTVCVVVLDPDSGDVEYCTAGHPPPLLVAATGETRYLPPTGFGPLGTDGTVQVRADRLGLGDVLVMFTDGITHPGVSPRASLHELSRVVQGSVVDKTSTPGASPRATVRATSAAVERVRMSGYVDDIVLLVAERVTPLAPFSAQATAHPDAVGTVRRSLARWLDPVEADIVDVTAVQHAVGELVTNVVEHSESSGPAAVTVTASLTSDGVLVCTVADTGRWRTPSKSPTGRGHGLAMVRGLVDRLDLTTTRDGTSAVLHHRLHRPARLLSGALLATAPTDLDDVSFALEERDGRVHLVGPLDLGSADELRVLLQRAAHHAPDELVVDLSDVTHLGSAGVQVLHDLLAGERSVRLTTRIGSPAEHVLDVVRLPYAPVPPY
jgi:anti-anti-sigma factor